LPGLTRMAAAWEIPHVSKQTTLVKADDKGRVSIRGTKKGQQYLVTAEGGGGWVIPAPAVSPPPHETEALVADTWEKLGPAPEIDYDNISWRAERCMTTCRAEISCGTV
jgi:hypothetical protein